MVDHAGPEGSHPILEYIEEMLAQLADMAAGQDRGDVEAYIRIAAVVAARHLPGG